MANKYPARHDDRRKELAMIHMAATQLGMDTRDQNDDSDYRSMLWSVARVRSSAALDWAGRKSVLDHLKACGWKPKSILLKPRPAPATDRAGLVGKIRALLIALDNKPDAYADGMARKMFGVERYEWCTPTQLIKIIAALNYAVKRATNKTPSPLAGQAVTRGGFMPPSQCLEGSSEGGGEG